MAMGKSEFDYLNTWVSRTVKGKKIVNLLKKVAEGGTSEEKVKEIVSSVLEEYSKTVDSKISEALSSYSTAEETDAKISEAKAETDASVTALQSSLAEVQSSVTALQDNYLSDTDAVLKYVAVEADSSSLSDDTITMVVEEE